MPKIKTLKSAKKRFTKTSSGKYKYKHAYTRHILTKKSSKLKRHLRHRSVLSNMYISKITKILPYI
ncbi:50S ribosomal protein L35 [Candidatus Blochmanniella vafra str. BVAF]|uniref:Large ribosomal subunit protein bL35 n=1 Tax=Blochmanniella vafra (strain BVAF) TaxID=859654 RepID=E8Q703_BLOVB|nr:50S ribosomal protein L35 [Candidatus Blochmannia vafer]ADV33750.1 50S ribosomal protein L35 [Candidatus Blochmannia vafer str. BVAF]